jgi:hypothetical protein
MTEDNPTSLSPEQQRLCLEITRRLRQSPAASVFNEPVDPKKQNLPNYFKKIRNPQDLGTIYQRLQAGEYTSVTQWERDINTVWSNAETFNGKDSFIGRIAQHMAWRFQHLKKPLDAYSVAGWTKHIYSLREKCDGLLAHCPPSLRGIIPHSLDNAMPIVAPFSCREMHAYILRTCERLTDPRDIEQVVAILRKNDQLIQVDDEFLVVDVNNLSLQTLCDIRSYWDRKQLSELVGGPHAAEPA